MVIASQALLGFDRVPWDLLIPLSAGLVAAGSALVLSRFAFAKSAAASPVPPAEKPNAEHDPFVQGSASEQRNAFRRRGGNPIKVQLGDPQQKGMVKDAWVVDRSMGGLCLAFNEAVAEGSVLEIRAANAPPATPWVEIQVKSCRQAKDDWELGCQFVKTPPWAVMLLFG